MPTGRRIALLAAVTALAALAAATPARALDLRGELRVRELTTDPSRGYAKDVTVAWRYTGAVYDAGGSRTPEAAAFPAVVGYEERESTSYEDGGESCRSTAFRGWAQGNVEGGVRDASGALREALPFAMQRQDRIRRRSSAWLSFYQASNYGLLETRDCNTGDDLGTDLVVLLSANAGLTPRRAVIGDGDWRHSAPTSYLSPGRVTMRLRRGLWRSSGTRRMSAPWGGGTRTIEWTWNLRSRRPSRHCALPSRRSVRGRTVAHARKLLRRAGLRPGGTLPDHGSRSVRPGRVTGFLALRDQPCGTRVAIAVRPVMVPGARNR